MRGEPSISDIRLAKSSHRPTECIPSAVSHSLCESETMRSQMAAISLIGGRTFCHKAVRHNSPACTGLSREGLRGRSKSEILQIASTVRKYNKAEVYATQLLCGFHVVRSPSCCIFVRNSLRSSTPFPPNNARSPSL